MDLGGHLNGLLEVHPHSQINASCLTSSNRWLGPLYEPYRYLPPPRIWFYGCFGLKTSFDFAHFALESCRVFKELTGVYKCI